jgi:hypothetical protein
MQDKRLALGPTLGRVVIVDLSECAAHNLRSTLEPFPFTACSLCILQHDLSGKVMHTKCLGLERNQRVALKLRDGGVKVGG